MMMTILKFSFQKKLIEFEILIQMIKIFSQDIKMEFGIEKYAIVIMNRERKGNNRRNCTRQFRKEQE